ncbi:MAG: TIGR02710 family CRISPR-associated protein [Ignavibacteriales bacterium]|nr:TIGR02710 family CRISPR-associated protein [Ignavibacteriales bacterium]
MASENFIKKLMFITLGTGKDGSDVAHGIYFSIKNQNPDHIVIIASSKSYEITFPHLEKQFNQLGKNIHIEKIIIEEIDDLEKLHITYSDIIFSFIKKGFKKQNIVVDYTSGTKAMSASLVSAAISLDIGLISYVTGDRKEGRVQSGTERISSIIPTKIFSQKLIKQFISLFNLFQYQAAINIIDDFEFHPDFRDKVNILRKLACFFYEWDKFNFANAFSLSKEINDDMLKKFNIKNKFKDIYIPLISELKNEELNYKKVNDLVYNAERRASEGKFDDAVARLYRALEMVAQIEFIKQFGCKTEDVNIEKLPQEIKNDIKFKYQNTSNRKIQLPMYKTFDVLNYVGNKYGKIFEENNVLIKKNISKRNYSILAHGSVPVDERHFKEFHQFLLDKFNLCYDNGKYRDFTFPIINDNILEYD